MWLKRESLLSDPDIEGTEPTTNSQNKNAREYSMSTVCKKKRRSRKKKSVYSSTDRKERNNELCSLF